MTTVATLAHPIATRTVQLAPARDEGEAWRAWAAHVDAGRIGAGAPGPRPAEAGCAGLERALASVRRVGVW